MSENLLLKESHAIVEYSNELTMAIDKLVFKLDIERIAVLQLLLSCLQKKEGEESGIILTNSTQFEI